MRLLCGVVRRTAVRIAEFWDKSETWIGTWQLEGLLISEQTGDGIE